MNWRKRLTNKEKSFISIPFFIATIIIGFVFIFLIVKIDKTKEIIMEINSNSFSQDLSFTQKETPFLIPLWEEAKKKLIVYGGDFIEVNIQEMETRLYRNGKLMNEFPILAIGNPSNWGGSPVGIYKILNKYNSAYSNSVQVYMPFAIQYYGKYFLHGIPYYPQGTKINSTFSGGCIRYSDENAQKIFDFSEDETLVLVIDKNRDKFQYSEINHKVLPDVSAEAFLVADLDSGVVLLEKNSNQKMPIASITKLMTTIVVSENIGFNRSILVREEMLEYYNDYGYNPEIKAGKRYQLIELLYPLLVKSSNQSSEIIANFLGKEETIKLMNEKARSMTMNKTSFADTSGLSEDNISTAHDLFYLARYLYNNFNPILSISKSERVPQVQYLQFNLNELENRNIFVYDPTFIGGKTGFTDISENTGLFIFSLPHESGQRTIVINLLKSKGLKKDTQAIYAWLLKNYFDN